MYDKSVKEDYAMEQTVNIPIQLISCCSTMGDITPLRFRFELEDHSLVTVNIDKILAHKDTSFNGIREIQYTCQANIAEEMKLFTLTYNINSHKWKLFRMLI